MSYEDGSGQITRRPRVNDGPPPVSGVLAIVLAVIAVVAGYFILKSITDDGGVTAGPGLQNPGSNTPSPSSTTPPGSTVPQLPPPSTEPPGLVTTGASVIVANANGRGGSAGNASRVLSSSAGFQMVDPTDANDSTPDLDTSVIYFNPANPAAETVANSLNTVMGGQLAVQPMPEAVPVREGNLNGADVLLMLGKDFAEMAPGKLDLTQINQAGGAVAANPPTVSSTTPPAG